MARWRTHHKRAARRVQQDAAFMAECDDLIKALTAKVTENAFAVDCRNLSTALLGLAHALQAGVDQMAKNQQH
jgi:hypothetical protein